jgi:hypothetical protein
MMTLALAGPASAERRGEWRLEARPGRSEVQLALHYSEAGWESWSGRSVRLAALVGLTRADLEARSADVRFRLTRDAGSFELEGQLEGGRGAGNWRFEPDAGFAALLERRGFAAPTSVEQFRLALADIGVSYLDELDTQGYRRPSTAGLVRMGEHGVDLDYLRGMGARQLRLGDPDALVRMRDHGVDPEFVDGLAAHGHRGLDTDTLLRLRDHGVDANFVAGIVAAGFPRLSPLELVRARDHGVDGRYARRARARFGSDLTIEDVIDLRNRGVAL